MLKLTIKKLENNNEVPSGVRVVNSLSKYAVWSDLETAGMKGGLVSLLYSFTQSIVPKNGWTFISSMPSGPDAWM